MIPFQKFSLIVPKLKGFFGTPSVAELFANKTSQQNH